MNDSDDFDDMIGRRLQSEGRANPEPPGFADRVIRGARSGGAGAPKPTGWHRFAAPLAIAAAVVVIAGGTGLTVWAVKGSGGGTDAAAAAASSAAASSAAASSAAASSASSSAASSPSAPASSASTGSSPVVPPASASTSNPVSSSSAPTGPVACRTADLSLSNDPSVGASGTGFTVYYLTNTGAATCTLDGYAQFAALDANGKVIQGLAVQNNLIQQAGAHVQSNPVLVTLTAGTRAQFLVSNVDNVPNPDCPVAQTAAAVQVIPPGETAALEGAGGSVACDLTVGPISVVG